MTRRNSDDRPLDQSVMPTVRQHRWRSRWLLALGAVTCAILLFMLLSKDRVLRLSSGFVEDRYFFAGVHIGSVDRESALGSIQVVVSANAPTGEVIVIPKSYLVRFGPSPSTYGGRLVTQCKTVGEILQVRDADRAEIERVWRAIATRGGAGACIDDLIRDLLSKP